MKKMLIAIVLVAAATHARALEVFLADAEGKRLMPGNKLDFQAERLTEENGVETVVCKLTSRMTSRQLLRIVATEHLKGATTVWDGRDELPKARAKVTRELLIGGYFLMGASWSEGNGIALASGAQDHNSYEDFIATPTADGIKIAISVRAALLSEGATYACRFHRIPFSPKYGIRDALSHYYPLYPQRFYRNAEINPAAMGICAHYSSWRWPNPESCRFNNATWEWCHGAGRSWGDPLNTEIPCGKANVDYTWDEELDYFLRDGKLHHDKNSKLSIEDFDRIQSARLANGYYCGIANGFYMMALANLSNKIAKRYPDSVATDFPYASNDYAYSTEVFTFPECSWGVKIREILAALVKKHDLGAVAFDVSRPRSVYRGEALSKMTNVSWDRHGPGVVRGIGSAKLFDYIRTLPNKKLSGTCAVAVNTKYQHVTDMLYMDMEMIEATPWDYQPPFPLNMRFALGEKGLTLWEGYSPREFDPNFTKWPLEDQRLLLHDLGRYAVHRSFVAGASLPCGFLTEYVGLCSHAFVRMNAAGFKPVLGMTVSDGGWELARYGLGKESYLALCNHENSPRHCKLTLYPGEIATGLVEGTTKANGFVFAPFFGGSAAHRFTATGERVTCEVGPLLAGVLEGVAAAKGTGDITASWSGDFEVAKLTIRSTSFEGVLQLRDNFETYVREGARNRTLKPDETIEVDFRNALLPGVTAKIRTFAFLDADKMPTFTMEYAGDGGDSKDMADRVSNFFKSVATKPLSVPRTENPTLAAHTLVLKDAAGAEIKLAADDREDFSHLVRRFLNAVNALRYPAYAPGAKLHDDERRFFTYLRY